jgi:phosphatidylglycerophosphatase A
MILGTWASSVAEVHYRVHDSPHIVIDELTGQLVTLVPVAFALSWPNLVVGFGLFRLFDTVKPWPASWIDRKMAGALGVMLDDVVAGLYAGAATALVDYTGVVNRIQVWLSGLIVG